MKSCPSCNRTFDDESLSFCPTDGSRLVGQASPPAGSEDYLQATIMATPSMRPPSSELPPPDAFSTNAAGGSGQFGQQPPPPPQQNPTWTDNQYQANAPWPGQQQQMPPPSQNPTWQAPSGGLAPAPAKKGMNTKLLIGGGLGCLGLLIVGVIGIAIIVAISGPGGKMNPYKGSLRDLAPSSLGNFTRTDVDTLSDRDKEGFGRIRDAIGVSYSKGKEREDTYQVFIGNYDSANDAKDGLTSFKNWLSSRGWTVFSERDKKIGWSTVGKQFMATRSFSSRREDDSSLQDGARMVYAQSASPSPAKSRERTLVCWTNGSVIYAVVGDDSSMLNPLQQGLDKAQK